MSSSFRRIALFHSIIEESSLEHQVHFKNCGRSLKFSKNKKRLPHALVATHKKQTMKGNKIKYKE